ncbi:peptidoglycan-binding protein LysM [Gillisia sp. Q332]|uniref:peptidoglycan-binding protein LysM n=1 Tax=Gillisia xinjiangensis TaxID=3384765 RepID=UPI00391BE453
MKRKVAKFSILPVVAGCLFFSFSTKEAANLEMYKTSSLDSIEYTVSAFSDSLLLELPLKAVPQLGKSYIGFKEAVAFKESRGDYQVVNEFGYMGKYQFGKGTLELIGIYNTKNFLNSPELQESAFYANASRNKWILIRDIKRFSGKKINGITITESGILAAAHLAGPGSVKKYLRSWGANAFSDAFGTTIGYYMKRFEGYDTSFVKPERKAKASLKV